MVQAIFWQRNPDSFPHSNGLEKILQGEKSCKKKRNKICRVNCPACHLTHLRWKQPHCHPPDH